MDSLPKPVLTDTSVPTNGAQVVALNPRNTVIGPPIPEHLVTMLREISTCQSVPSTYRRAITLWIGTATNPKYVEQVNTAIDRLEGFVSEARNLSDLDLRTKTLFLSYALDWTNVIRVTNQINGITDFENRGMIALSEKLLKAGASQEYFEIVSFFRAIEPVAFKQEGPRFAYPNLRDSEDEEEIRRVKHGANGILMRLGGSWSLVNAESGPDQNEVCKALRTVVKAMQDDAPESASAKLSNEELLYGQALVAQVMTNYVSNIDAVPRVGNEVFSLLAEFHALLVARLKQGGRSKLGIQLPPASLSHLIETFDVVKGVLRQEKFQEFYCKADSTETLNSIKPIVDLFIKFNTTPAKLVRDNCPLTILSTDSQSGVHVYRKGKPGDASCDLVVFLNGNDQYWDKMWAGTLGAFSAGRGTAFENLQGLVQDHALTAATKARAHLQQVLDANRSEMGKIGTTYLVGAGLDACSAQLLGFDRAKASKDEKVTVIGCGMPAYLDETASQDMLNQMDKMQRLRCVNFILPNDPNMGNLGFTAPFGLRYEGSAFTWVPVPKVDLFTGEKLAKAPLKAYLQIMPVALDMHTVMREVFVSADKVVKYLEGSNASTQSVPLIQEVDEEESN